MLAEGQLGWGPWAQESPQSVLQQQGQTAAVAVVEAVAVDPPPREHPYCQHHPKRSHRCRRYSPSWLWER